jgi:hypothetical protein
MTVPTRSSLRGRKTSQSREGYFPASGRGVAFALPNIYRDNSVRPRTVTRYQNNEVTYDCEDV